MSHDSEFSALIGRIYDAALEPAVWPVVLEEIAVQFNAVCGYMFIADLTADEIQFAALNQRFAFDSAEQYGSYYRYIDERLANLLASPSNRAFADWQLIAPGDFHGSEFYNDFYVPHGLDSALVGLPDQDEEITVGVCIARPPRSDPFDNDEIDKAQLLFPHFARATRIMRRTAEVESIASSEATALDRISVGIFIVDGTARPVFVNRTGQQIISQFDGLRISPEGLGTDLPDETVALRRAIGLAAIHSDDNNSNPGAAMTISRPSLRRPFQVLVAPIGSAHLPVVQAQEPGLVLVLVSDPETKPPLLEETIARLYGMSSAEARLAVQLTQGLSLKEISESTGRSLHTLRWTLKNIFAKTDTKRQAELVKLILMTPAITGNEAKD